MSRIGTVFDIEQLTVTDGPGVRTTVFLKGCPLRCIWCHNPEGLSFQPQRMVSSAACIHCGLCTQVCPHQEDCTGCGKCVEYCPGNARRIVGKRYTAEELATLLLRDRDYLMAQGGGVTFSGGEPTAQGEFLIEVLTRLSGMHRAIETCGYCPTDLFQKILGHLDYVIMDIKLASAQEHIRCTGVDNSLILKNLAYLKESGKPFLIRTPLIPGLTDTRENLSAIAALLPGSRNLQGVELLPYHRTAGAKYAMVGREYRPGFDETKPPRQDPEPFERLGIPCRVL